MPRKTARIWNSEIAYRIDSQFSSSSDRAIFRKLLAQNELDEAQLRSLLRRWRQQGKHQSFCEFLVNAGLVSIEMRKIVSWGSTECNLDHGDLYVSLTPQARSELDNRFSFVDAIIKFIRSVLVKSNAKPKTSNELEELALLRKTTEPSSENNESRSQSIQDRQTTPSVPVPILATTEEFDPYATVC